MSTKSYIAKQNSDGTITYIYCHFDGYLDGVGRTLSIHYAEEAILDALLQSGDIIGLGNSPEVSENYPDSKAFTVKDEQELIKHFKESLCEYCYLFKGNQWHVLEYKGQFKPLDEQLRKLAETTQTQQGNIS